MISCNLMTERCTHVVCPVCVTRRGRCTGVLPWVPCPLPSMRPVHTAPAAASLALSPQNCPWPGSCCLWKWLGRCGQSQQRLTPVTDGHRGAKPRLDRSAPALRSCLLRLLLPLSPPVCLPREHARTQSRVPETVTSVAGPGFREGTPPAPPCTPACLLAPLWPFPSLPGSLRGPQRPL